MQTIGFKEESPMDTFCNLLVPQFEFKFSNLKTKLKYVQPRYVEKACTKLNL